MHQEIEALPGVLRTLLEAELAAGNEIVEVGHSFPAPPTGAFFKLSKPLLTRERKSGDGIDYRARNGTLCSGEITDGARRYFLMEPPLADGTQGFDSAPRMPGAFGLGGSAAQIRFQGSTVIDYEKWRDGDGYDLDAWAEMSTAEKQSAEAALISRGVHDWRDVEALLHIRTAATIKVVQAAIDHPDPMVKIAIARFAPEFIPASVQEEIAVSQLGSAVFFDGLGPVLDWIAEFHPPQVIAALLRGALGRPGQIAVHFAAMLCYVRGQAPEPFDFKQRSFFLRFDTESRTDREAAFTELCQKIGVNPAPYLSDATATSADVPIVNRENYTVEVDERGEVLTYCEPDRSAHVICTFRPVPCIATRTLSNWYYPRGRRTEKMNAAERELILNRIAADCRKNHRMSRLTFE